ncbi:M14 family zinc carboxypeptidase [Daejeonella sp.]|uniref:M14 family zinc carboxypeptidase n=1 Tax=Daejeonella sp. TaxID=2805397 RepID=UPI0027214D34|nr:M14 family zinc carboxypeptidase [Daejeonella sp.]MDO8994603.1 M14 family zinc carboxypeptidase [Daejeonella sp.]MDP2413715.1 M14 family zinc carboxypeptidase [Daejeonella sp.]
MDALNILMENYQEFEETRIKDRFFKHADLLKILGKLKTNSAFSIKEAGMSTKGLSINLVTWGKGPKRVFLWSQMHGDEATATMAIADLLNFLSQPGQFRQIHDLLAEKCTLYILPLVNPDGAEVFNRRNAMNIDINRDFHRQQSPEGRILRHLRDEINPHFGFNLHDQSTLWSAGHTGNPATISLLAPAYDEGLSINSTREQAMKVIAIMNSAIQKSISDQVGRFDDEYEPRAFGDNFQAAGTSTILIEAGGFYNDPEKQYIRKVFFKAILSGLISIADETYLKAKTKDYFSIPENKKLHFHILLRNCKLEKNGIPYKLDIGLCAEEKVTKDAKSVKYTYMVTELGDLSDYFGYVEFNCEFLTLTEKTKLKLDEPADLIVHHDKNILIKLKNGVLKTVIGC